MVSKFANCAEYEEHHKFGILDTCAELHDLSVRGPGPASDPDEAREMRDWLQKRYDNWSTGPLNYEYDQVIRRLVGVVLAECNTAFERPNTLAKTATWAEPKTTDYCMRCGESPESGTHMFGHDYVDPRGDQ